MFNEKEYCRSCGTLYPANKLSGRGLCSHCGMERLFLTIKSLQEHKGWIWEKWKRNYIASLSGVIERLQSNV